MAGTTVRTRTRVIGIVHSHIRKDPFDGVIDLSKDITNISCTKVLKGAGTLQVGLVPRVNYLNYLYPNDIINIYIDNGEGSGFIRTFFGYIDRIERNIAVDDQGVKSTSFRLVATDMTKVIDRTDIYFNPNLSNRKELFGQFGASNNESGAALRTAGLITHGTPAELVENTLQILLGFGQQWKLPETYPEHFLDESRRVRTQRAKARIPKKIVDRLAALGYGNIEQTVTDPLLLTQLLNDINEDANKIYGQDVDLTNISLKLAGVAGTRVELAQILQGTSQLQAYKTVLNSINSPGNVSLLDILDLSFIEAMTIDGYLSSQTIWSQTGTLASFLQGTCNEVVNELFYDLRPVADADEFHDSCFGTIYSRDSDELGINVEGVPGFPANTAAVQYRPAVIMREYPYSVVEGLDLSKYRSIDNNLIGKVPFGPVFAQEPNVPGRKLYQYDKTLNPEPCAFEEISKPFKHLDVAVIHDSDVIEESVGRSDAEVFNLFALYATDNNSALYKFLLSEFLPIITPVSVLRNGLRVHEMQTKFATYSRDQLCGPTTTVPKSQSLLEKENAIRNAGGSGIPEVLEERYNTGSAVDSYQVRQNLIRWSLLIDSWNQHNHEFLSGTIKLGPRPDIRVGYRLDWVERSESYYVESVSHEWAYPGRMITTLQVSRGQRNDPFPAYIPPVMPMPGGEYLGSELYRETKLSENASIEEEKGKKIYTVTRQVEKIKQISNQVATGGGNRSESGRLSEYFDLKDPTATARGVGAYTNQDDENEIDQHGNANLGGTAEYAFEPAVEDRGVFVTFVEDDIEKTEYIQEDIKKRKKGNKK